MIERTVTKQDRSGLTGGRLLCRVLAFGVAFVAAAPGVAADIDLYCSSPSPQNGGSIAVYDKALGGWPNGLVKEIEAGKSYDVSCRYSVKFPIADSSFSLPPWKIRLIADGVTLAETAGAQEPVGVSGTMGIGIWSTSAFAEWTPKSGASHGILCALDVTDAVAEPSEGNNTCTLGFGPGVSARLPGPGELEMEAKRPVPGLVRPPPSETRTPPRPDPGPEVARAQPGDRVALNPQPEPPSNEVVRTTPRLRIPFRAIPPLADARLPAKRPEAADREPSGGALRRKPGDPVGTVRAVPAGTRMELRPDLEFTIGVYGGGTIYPLGVTVHNTGHAPSAATTFRVTCEEQAGGQAVGQCLSQIDRSVPALPAGGHAAITMPHNPWPMHCDPSPDPPHVEVCVLTAVVDPAGGVSEMDEANNTQVFHVAPK